MWLVLRTFYFALHTCQRQHIVLHTSYIVLYDFIAQSKIKKMKYATHCIKEIIKFTEKSRKISCVGVFFVYLHAK